MKKIIIMLKGNALGETTTTGVNHSEYVRQGVALAQSLDVNWDHYIIVQYEDSVPRFAYKVRRGAPYQSTNEFRKEIIPVTISTLEPLIITRKEYIRKNSYLLKMIWMGAGAVISSVLALTIDKGMWVLPIFFTAVTGIIFYKSRNKYKQYAENTFSNWSRIGRWS